MTLANTSLQFSIKQRTVVQEQRFKLLKFKLYFNYRAIENLDPVFSLVTGLLVTGYWIT